jgi:hypothetical protein
VAQQPTSGNKLGQFHKFSLVIRRHFNIQILSDNVIILGDIPCGCR